jgi:hypothetical protein
MDNVGTIFYNADYVVIEYMDLIKSPYLVLLGVLKENPRIREILKIEDIQYYDDAALCEWYIQRKHKNFLMDLYRFPENLDKDATRLDELLNDQICLTPKFYEYATPLRMVDSLISIHTQNIAKGIIIYHPHDNDFAKKDLKQLTGIDFTFMSDFKEVMKKAGHNSTYFLSDIDHLMEMKEYGVLKFSSVTLPIEYRYNKKNMEDMKYDLVELAHECPFKFSYYLACSYANTGGSKK